jgi:hypothetical protein
MNTLAFILALIGIILFVVHFVDARRNWTSLGLAFATAAFVLQLVMTSGGKVTF